MPEGSNYSAGNGRRRNHYKILHEEDIKQIQQNNISTLSGVLSVSEDVACTLLSRNKWNLTSACDEWFAAADGIEKNPPAERESYVCKICYEETSTLENAVSTACGHPFCAECWKKYIATAINDGVGCLTLVCPEPGCEAGVGVDIVDRMATAEEREKYHKYLNRSYVEKSRRRKWCPAPGCDRAVEYDSESESHDVVCDCSHRFCWRCGNESHRPVDCETAAEWRVKCLRVVEEWMEGELSLEWISSHAKRCRKCCRPIKKTEGCNHMICPAPCRFEFCWECLLPWKNHGGSFYRCEKVKEKVKAEILEAASMKADILPEGLKHYYEKWDSNEKLMNKYKHLNLNLCDDDRAVSEAWEKMVCQRVLKWCYAYGYFLSLEKKNSGKMSMFECLLGQAEAALERVYHCVEEEEKEKKKKKEMMMNNQEDDEDEGGFKRFRPNFVNLTCVATTYFQNLVASLESDLREVEVAISCDEESSKNNKSKMQKI